MEYIKKKGIIQKIFILIFVFTLPLFSVHANHENELEKLRAQEERVDEIEEMVDILFVLAERSDKREKMEERLNKLLGGINSIREAIKNRRKEMIGDATEGETLSSAIEKIRYRNWKEAKNILLKIDQSSPYYQKANKKISILEEVLACDYRKGEYESRIYDSEGRVTGLVNGEVKEEIPHSFYCDVEDAWYCDKGQITIYEPNDIHIREMFAIEGGNYKYEISIRMDGEIEVVSLKDIPINTGDTHQIKRKELTENEAEEWILLVDEGSTGEFEKKVSFPETGLNCEEFIIKTQMPEIDLFREIGK